MLSPRQLVAVELLAGGKPGRAVAKTIQVHESTLSNWRRCHEFQQALSNKQHEIVAELRAGLLEASRTAISTLTRVSAQADDPMASVAASKAILQHSRLVPESSQGVSGAELCLQPSVDLPDSIQCALSDLESYAAGQPLDDNPLIAYLDSQGLLDPEPLNLLISDMSFLAHQLAEFQSISRQKGC